MVAVVQHSQRPQSLPMQHRLTKSGGGGAIGTSTSTSTGTGSGSSTSTTRGSTERTSASSIVTGGGAATSGIVCG